MSVYYWICFIYNRIISWSDVNIVLYIGDDVTGDVGDNQTSECVMVETPPFHVATRFCHHMGPDDKLSACGICKLVCFIQ